MLEQSLIGATPTFAEGRNIALEYNAGLVKPEFLVLEEKTGTSVHVFGNEESRVSNVNIAVTKL